MASIYKWKTEQMKEMQSFAACIEDVWLDRLWLSLCIAICTLKLGAEQVLPT